MTRIDEIRDRLFMANESRNPSNTDRPPEDESLWHLTDAEVELWSTAKGTGGDIAYLLQRIWELESERDRALMAVYDAKDRGVLPSWLRKHAFVIEAAKRLARGE